MTQATTAVPHARDAAAHYSWREAFDLFAAADAADPLGPGDLDLMAECAWWIGKMRHCIALRERAHAAYLKDGNDPRAARVAIDLAEHHANLGEMGDAAAWIQKAERLLEDLPEGAEHGWLHLTMGLMRHGQGDQPAALEHAVAANTIGARHQDRDLFALSHAFHGVVLVSTGEAEQGLRLVEEATEVAVSGELKARATGMIYCMMISVNAELADWQRAGVWTEAAVRWCERQAINGFPGVCRVHRAEILRLRGAFAEAEEEARTATTELGSFNLDFAAMAFRELGEVRLRMGDLDAAEDAFRQANEMGVNPQPGLALALVQRGKTFAAANTLRRALADPGLGILERAKLLPTQVEVALLMDDVATAHEAVEELGTIAASYPSPALRATADAGAAAVRLADGALADAGDAARSAREAFEGIDLAYEAGKLSMLLGQIYLAQGDRDLARTETASALTTFERIGARPDADRARAALASLEGQAVE